MDAMIEMYLMVFLCIIIALGIGFLAVTIYMGWVLVQHDLEEQRKEDVDGKDRID